MKKILLWLMVVTVVVSMVTAFSLAGCKKEEAAETVAVGKTVESTSDETDETTEEAETTVVEVDPASFVGEINLMSPVDLFGLRGPKDEPTLIEMFNEVYPNIKVNFTFIPTDEYPSKLDSTFLAGTGIPDVFTGEQSYVKKWISSDYWENLSAAPYNAEDLVKDQFSYVNEFATDADGNLRGLTFQATPGAVYYRKSIAQEAFGVSEPADVSAMMTTMDDFIKMGETIKEETGGFLIAGILDIERFFFFNNKQPWVMDGKLVIDDAVLDFLDRAKEIRDKGLEAGTDMWSAEWSAAMNTNVFAYCLPTWGLFYVIEPAITEPEEDLAEGVNYSYGDWGLASGPVPYMWGGTWLGISKTSTNKDLAWEFVKFINTNKDFLKDYATLRSDFTSDIKVNEEIMVTGERESLGGQNFFEYFIEEGKNLDKSGWAKRVTQYDEDIQAAFRSAVVDYVNGNTTRDGAIQTFKDTIAALYPEISVE